MTDRILCATCGTPNAARDTFCGACGAPLNAAAPPMINCWNCRTPNPAGRAYCSNCGQHLAGPQPAVPPPMPATPIARPAERPRPRKSSLPVALASMLVLGLAGGLGFVFLAGGFESGPGGGDASPSPAVETEGPLTTLAPLRSPGRPGNLRCGPSEIEGPEGSAWSLGEVSFRSFQNYDRVVYHLERTGSADASVVPVVTVRRLDPREIALAYQGVEAPRLGDTAVMVGLYNGVRDAVRLRHFEPRGTRVVQELSTFAYQSHPNWSPGEDPHDLGVGLTSPIGVVGEGCYQLRAPAWRDIDAADRDSAEIFVDIERSEAAVNPRTEAPAPILTIPPATGVVPGPPTSYTCDTFPVSISAPDLSQWQLRQVSFRTFRDYDRVIFHLRRTSTQSSATPFVEARLLEEPSAFGTMALAMRMADGVIDRTGLDRYQPRGMKIVEAVSTGSSGSQANIGVEVTTEGCYQLRIPAWEAPPAVPPDDVDVYLDFRN